MSNISKAYADALFELSIEENILDEIMDQTLFLKQVMDENADFVKLLGAPTVTKDEKAAITDNVFSGKINKHLLNFIKVMIQRKDTAEMNSSFADFEKLYNKHNNIEKAVVTTAVAMSDELKARLVDKLQSLTGKKILLTNKVDPACLGGAVLLMEDMQFNDSISNKLETLKNQLKA